MISIYCPAGFLALTVAIATTTTQSSPLHSTHSAVARLTFSAARVCSKDHPTAGISTCLAFASASIAERPRGTTAFPRLPPNRTCGGHAKIDANDPTRASRDRELKQQHLESSSSCRNCISHKINPRMLWAWPDLHWS